MKLRDPKKLLYVPEGFKFPATMGRYCYAADLGPQLHFYVGPPCKLRIGSFVSFGPNVVIHVGGEHRKEWVSTYPFSELFDDMPHAECVATKGDVVIGSDVWIGSNVIILSGVTIGHGAIIGAGSVVTKDVDHYSIVAGNPIREIRKRFTEKQIDGLLKLRWWNLTDDEIGSMASLLMSNNVDQLLEGTYNEISAGNKT